MIEPLDDAWEQEEIGDSYEELKLAQVDDADRVVRESDNSALLDCIEVWKTYFGPIPCPTQVLAIFLLCYRAGRLRERREQVAG